jgi:hypothetical protein
MQVNNRPRITSLADAAPFTIAHVETPVEAAWTAAEIKAALKKSCIDYSDRSGQF